MVEEIVETFEKGKTDDMGKVLKHHQGFIYPQASQPLETWCSDHYDTDDEEIVS